MPAFTIGQSVVLKEAAGTKVMHGDVEARLGQAGVVIGIWVNEEHTHRYLVRYWTITGKHEDWCVEKELAAVKE